MHVVADRIGLAGALGVVSRAISSRSTLPILGNVRLRANEGRLHLTATDLDTSIQTEIEAGVKTSGATSVPASLLSQVVSSLPGKDVSLEVKDGQLRVQADKADYSMLTLPAEEFPGIPEVSDELSIEINEKQFKTMVRQTIFASAREEANPILTGVLFDLRPGDKSLRLVATDTHRLSWRTTPIEKGSKQKISIIIPNRPLNEIARLLKDSDEMLQIRLASNQVEFILGVTRIVSRVIDGQFPSYEKVIPGKSERKVKVNTQEMLNVFKRVSIVARANSDKTVLQMESDRMVVSAESQEVGKAREELPIVLEGDPIEIAFNGQYLIDALNVVDTADTTLEFTGSLNPGVLKPASDDGFVYVVMPMQI